VPYHCRYLSAKEPYKYRIFGKRPVKHPVGLCRDMGTCSHTPFVRWVLSFSLFLFISFFSSLSLHLFRLISFSSSLSSHLFLFISFFSSLSLHLFLFVSYSCSCTPLVGLALARALVCCLVVVDTGIECSAPHPCTYVVKCMHANGCV